jgi:NAD(P)-dependent dehydrogenase (short-subunit alcohol dehydrogenase family)
MRLFAEGGMMAANIQWKVVVITGASSGVGESTARLLAGNGAKVVLGARRKDRIDAVVKDITAKGGSALGFKTDVTKRGDVEALDTGSVDKYGRIDAIVNNSGIMPIAPMATLKVEECDRMIEARSEWLQALDKIESLHPIAVVAGHGVLDSDSSPRHIEETRRYLRDFAASLASTSTAIELYETMLSLHPHRVNPGSLWAAAKASKLS